MRHGDQLGASLDREFGGAHPAVLEEIRARVLLIEQRTGIDVITVARVLGALEAIGHQRQGVIDTRAGRT